jgi:hypothetical protein
MKWRAEVTLSPQSQPIITKKRVLTHQSNLPPAKPNLRSITRQSLDSIGIDLSPSTKVGSLKANARAVW